MQSDSSSAPAVWDTRWGSLAPLQRCSWCNLQLQPSGVLKFKSIIIIVLSYLHIFVVVLKRDYFDIVQLNTNNLQLPSLDPLMGPNPVLTLRVRVEFEIMLKTKETTFSRAANEESHHRMQFSVIFRTPFFFKRKSYFSLISAFLLPRQANNNRTTIIDKPLNT